MKKRYIISAIFSLVLIVLAFLLWQISQNGINDASLSNIKKNGVLKVGSDLDFENLEYHSKNNKLSGINIDIAQKIADNLGVALVFKNFSHQELLAKIKSGEIDLAMTEIPETIEQNNNLTFISAYYSTGQVIIERKDDKKINGINDLINKKIGVKEDSNAYTEAKKYSKVLVTYNQLNDSLELGAINDLKQGNIDAIVADYTNAIILARNDVSLKIIGTPFATGSYGLAARSDNKSLISKINKIMNDLENDGTMNKIEENWPLI